MNVLSISQIVKFVLIDLLNFFQFKLGEQVNCLLLLVKEILVTVYIIGQIPIFPSMKRFMDVSIELEILYILISFLKFSAN